MVVEERETRGGGREGGTQWDEDLPVGFTSSQDRQCPDAAGRACTLLRAVCGVMSVQLWCFDPPMSGGAAAQEAATALQGQARET